MLNSKNFIRYTDGTNSWNSFHNTLVNPPESDRYKTAWTELMDSMLDSEFSYVPAYDGSRDD